MGSLKERLGFFEMTLPDGRSGYALIDMLNQLACPLIPDKNEILSFLNDEGWKIESEINDDDDESEEE